MELDHDPPFETLLHAHIDALTGSLFEGVTRGPGQAGVVFSRTIPDPTLNFAYGIRNPAQFSWAGASALARGRSPAFLARDDEEHDRLLSLFKPSTVYPASWMVARALPSPARTSSPPSLRISSTIDQTFEEIFTRAYADATVQAHLRRFYVPAMRSAKPRVGLTWVHLTLSDPLGPAACASLAVRGHAAGLYNVSTRFDRQKQGLASRLVQAALREAKVRHAANVFLQCPAKGPIEAFYEKSGFRTLYRPSLLCTSLTD